MTDQTVRAAKTKRDFFGHLFKWSFILFNAVMAWVLFSGLSQAWRDYSRAGSEGMRGEAVFAIALSAGVLLFLWASGGLLLGLFMWMTRGK